MICWGRSFQAFVSANKQALDFAIDFAQKLNDAHGCRIRQAIVNGLAFTPGLNQVLFAQNSEVL
jgi:hypothetical protein